MRLARSISIAPGSRSSPASAATSTRALRAKASGLSAHAVARRDRRRIVGRAAGAVLRSRRRSRRRRAGEQRRDRRPRRARVPRPRRTTAPARGQRGRPDRRDPGVSRGVAPRPRRVVNIGSIGGRMAQPFLGPYNASKFALEALTDSLRLELHAVGDRGLDHRARQRRHPDLGKADESADAVVRRSPRAGAGSLRRRHRRDAREAARSPRGRSRPAASRARSSTRSPRGGRRRATSSAATRGCRRSRSGSCPIARWTRFVRWQIGKTGRRTSSSAPKS